MTPEQIEQLKELTSDSTDFYLSCKSAAAGLGIPYPGQFAQRINSAIADGELKGDVQRVALAVLDNQDQRMQRQAELKAKLVASAGDPGRFFQVVSEILND